MSKFNRRRLWVSFSGFESPEELIILKSFRDAGQWYYRCKLISCGTIVDIQVGSVDYIMHRKSKVKKLNTKIRLVK